jgi:prevent-host-death family protein
VKYDLTINLETGVVPISKAASSLAAIIKRSKASHQPVIVTQKGYPTGVILDIELFTHLRELFDLHGEGAATSMDEIYLAAANQEE